MKLRPLAGLFTLLLAFPPSSFFAQEGFSPGRLARMQEAITASVDRQEYAGVNVVVARHGQTVFAESFGHRNQEDHQLMQPDTIFWIASMTKPVTAVAVMMLYEEGRFLLEDPVSKYLPAFAEIKVLASEEDPAGQTIRPLAPSPSASCWCTPRACSTSRPIHPPTCMRSSHWKAG
jgi:CubicO group peptidase (beta-lactamase class C family)